MTSVNLPTSPTSESTTKKLPWEYFAGPGHVLLAKLKVLSKHGAYFDKATQLCIVGVLLLLIALGFSVFSQATVKALGERVSTWGVRTFSDRGTKAPSLKQLSITYGAMAPEQVAGLTTVPDAIGWINQSIDALNKGSQPQYCNTSAKITESWLVGDGSQPNCRVTKENVWVWALLRKGEGDYASVLPLAGVFHKQETGWRFFSIAEARIQFNGIESISLSGVPRVVSRDLPELTVQQE